MSTLLIFFLLISTIDGNRNFQQLHEKFFNHVSDIRGHIEKEFVVLTTPKKKSTARISLFSRNPTATSQRLQLENDANCNNMFDVINSGDWERVVVTDDANPIKVWKKNLPPGTHLANEHANDASAAKFACIKATAIIESPPHVVYKLFLDNSRVREYNEHCHKVAIIPFSS